MENCPEILKVCIYFLVFLALGLEPARFYIYSRAGSFQQKTQTFSKKNGVFNRCRVFFFFAPQILVSVILWMLQMGDDEI